MTSIEALDFAIRRLVVDRNHFVHIDAHNDALATLIALRELIAERQQRLDFES